MTLDELGDLLASVFPTAYLDFPEDEVPAMPYLCYAEDNAENFAADNIVFFSRRNVMIALYTKKRDLEAEAAVEAALTAAGLFWTRDVDFLEDEDAYEIIYYTEV